MWKKPRTPQRQDVIVEWRNVAGRCTFHIPRPPRLPLHPSSTPIKGEQGWAPKVNPPWHIVRTTTMRWHLALQWGRGRHTSPTVSIPPSPPREPLTGLSTMGRDPRSSLGKGNDSAVQPWGDTSLESCDILVFLKFPLLILE